MEIKDIIKRLERVRNTVDCLVKDAGVPIELWQFDDHWEISIYESTACNADRYYHKEFDTLDELENHLEGMRVGITLMLCKEI